MENFMLRCPNESLVIGEVRLTAMWIKGSYVCVAVDDSEKADRPSALIPGDDMPERTGEPLICG